MPDPNSFDPDATLEAYTVDRFCAAFGLGRTFVYEQIKTRKLRAVKSGNRTLILRRDVEAWICALPPLDTGRRAD